MHALITKHWQRLRRSLTRRYREAMLPRGYQRLGTRYGGWWVDTRRIGQDPFVIDCGLGEDLSFPTAFLQRFGGRVIGVDPNPRSLAYCRAHCPSGMEIRDQALWIKSGETLTFHLPRPQHLLPQGADGVSGSLHDSHHGVIGGEGLEVTTATFLDLLAAGNRRECDLLKLDIEGAEYDVLNELCRSDDIRRAGQVVVEFHHGKTHHQQVDTDHTAEAMKASGFELIYVELRNYIFRRQGPTPVA